MSAWRFDTQTNTLFRDGAPVAYITSASMGHVHDTGQLIALLLSWHEDACQDNGTGFFAALSTIGE